MPSPEPVFPSDVRSLADGRYVLASRIGEGGMAAVYRCWDRRLRVWRAVKVLLPEHAGRAKVRARFESEGLTMGPLEHPNLVRVYDVGHAGDLPFLVMELVDGGTFSRWTERYGAMPPRMAVRAVLQVVDGLFAVHAGGVVHRDVKPKNVLVSPAGVCKLTDFGIARNDPDGVTKPGAVLGTLEYMAPEQRIDAKSVDVRADVYGVGATLWHLLRAEDRPDLFRIESDAALQALVPVALREPLLRCLAWDRGRRYGSATALMSAWAGLVDALPPDPPGTPGLHVEPSESQVDAAAEQTFADLEERLDQITPRGPLPYTMPPVDRRDPARAEPEWVDPGWIDRSPPTLAEPRTVVAPPVLRPEAPARVSRGGWLPTRSVVAVALLVVGVAGVLGSEVTSVSAAEAATVASRDRLFQVLTEEHPVVIELMLSGADPEPLEQAWDTFSDRAGAVERLAAARAFAERVAAETDARVDPASTGVYEVQLRRRAKRIQGALEAHDTARRRWDEAANGLVGRGVVWVGLVRAR